MEPNQAEATALPFSIESPKSCSMSKDTEPLDDLVRLSHALGDEGAGCAILAEGNTSAIVDARSFYVKASGRSLSTITEEGFCRVASAPILEAMTGPPIDDAGVKELLLASVLEAEPGVMPSVETFFHAWLLTLPDVRFIGHTHPTALNALLCSQKAVEHANGRLFPDHIVSCGPAACFVDYVDPGIPLAIAIREAVEAYIELWSERPKTIFMRNHGLIALGATSADVRAATSMCVKAAEVLQGTIAFGGPHFLSPEQVQRIHRRPDEAYRRQQIER